MPRCNPRAFATTDFRPDLISLIVPTLVIHGTSDRTVPIDATGRKVALSVPNAQIIEYDGEPHGLFATQTERLADDIVAFLNGGLARSDVAALDTAPRNQRQAILDDMTAASLATSPATL